MSTTVTKANTVTTTTVPLTKTGSRKETLQKFAFAGMSCMTAACVTNPLDVIKVRLQLQGNAAPGTALKYRGFFTGLITMLKEEGIRSWYRGLSASLVREGTYSTLRVGLYEPFKDLYHGDNSTPLPLYKKILAAMSSGAVAASLTNPADLVKVRMQALSTDGKPRYTSLLQAWKTIYGQEGFGGLYRGVSANCQRAMLSTASQLASYDHIKHYILDSGILEEGLLCHFATAVGAGFIFACVTSPVDTIKSRYMSQQFSPSGKGLQYASTIDCVKQVIAKEGPLALYKGFFPNWARIGPHTIVTFLALEQLRKMAGIQPI